MKLLFGTFYFLAKKGKSFCGRPLVTFIRNFMCAKLIAALLLVCGHLEDIAPVNCKYCNLRNGFKYLSRKSVSSDRTSVCN